MVTKNIEDVGERMCKVVRAPDRIGPFVWKTMSETLIYAVNRIGEIADDVVNIDRAMKWGFNWELGPFETWDTLGVEYVAGRLEKEGRQVPKLIQDMLAKGIKKFYQDETPEPLCPCCPSSTPAIMCCSSSARKLTLLASCPTLSANFWQASEKQFNSSLVGLSKNSSIENFRK